MFLKDIPGYRSFCLEKDMCSALWIYIYLTKQNQGIREGGV